jgi:GNAT superfamily N-acetyltransferase
VTAQEPFTILIEPLGKHTRDDFQCGIDELDRYFHHQAGQDARKRVAAPFVLVNQETGKVAGYYTLSMNSVVTQDLPLELAKKLPRYEALPAVLLGRLAVDQQYQGHGLGELLLLDALQRSLENPIAAMCVVVDAINDQALAFYERYGFIRLADLNRRLFLPMKTIEKLF